MAIRTTERIGPIAAVSDLPEGRSRGFDPLGEGHDSMFIVRKGDRLHAWRNLCPHYERARMAWRKDEYLSADRRQIVCGAHGAMFEIDTGECTIGPCLGKRLTPVPLEVREGQIWVLGPYEPFRKPRQRG